MNNHECVIRVLTSHREARGWTDEAVCSDLLAQLGLDPADEAKNAAPAVDPGISEDEVRSLEAVAKEATDKAEAARAAFNAQQADPEAEAKAQQQQAEADAKAKAEIDDAVSDTKRGRSLRG